MSRWNFVRVSPDGKGFFPCWLEEPKIMGNLGEFERGQHIEGGCIWPFPETPHDGYLTFAEAQEVIDAYLRKLEREEAEANESSGSKLDPNRENFSDGS